MKKLLLAFAAILVFVVAALAMMPAATAIAWVLPENSPLQLDDARGSLWHGRAGYATWLGRPVGHLEWEWQPSALLHGELAYAVTLRGFVFAKATLARDASLSQVRDLHATLPASWLDPVLATPGLRPIGILEISLPVADIVPGHLANGDGELVWKEAAFAAVPVPLGDIHLPFRIDENGRALGVIKHDFEALSVRGELDARLPNYRLDVVIIPHDLALSLALRWLGQPTPEGGRRLILMNGAEP